MWSGSFRQNVWLAVCNGILFILLQTWFDLEGVYMQALLHVKFNLQPIGKPIFDLFCEMNHYTFYIIIFKILKWNSSDPIFYKHVGPMMKLVNNKRFVFTEGLK